GDDDGVGEERLAPGEIVGEIGLTGAERQGGEGDEGARGQGADPRCDESENGHDPASPPSDGSPRERRPEGVQKSSVAGVNEVTGGRRARRGTRPMMITPRIRLRTQAPRSRRGDRVDSPAATMYIPASGRGDRGGRGVFKADRERRIAARRGGGWD